VKTFKQFIAEEDQEIYAKKIEGAPDWAPQYAEDNYRVGSITFSAKDGLGSVPFNQSVYYHGLVGEMKPSTFLELALPHDGQREDTKRELIKLVKDGYVLGIPWFTIDFKDTDDHDGFPRVTGHEGRGRMLAIKELIGDVPVPVHLMLGGGMRARHLEEKHLKKLMAGLMAERSNSVIKTPFVTLYVNGKKI
jgi:hypothetical protein